MLSLGDVLRCRQLPNERGQALILAAATLLFFYLLSVAVVLRFASTSENERGSTERTAEIDSLAEGEAQFAPADAP
jgi:hypothetical protein